MQGSTIFEKLHYTNYTVLELDRLSLQVLPIYLLLPDWNILQMLMNKIKYTNFSFRKWRSFKEDDATHGGHSCNGSGAVVVIAHTFLGLGSTP